MSGLNYYIYNKFGSDYFTETPPRETIKEEPEEYIVPKVKPKPPLIMDDEGC